jgi:hypothetical protein
MGWDVGSGGGGIAWGSITGTLSDQTDLDDRFNILEDQIEIYEIFELISSGTSGTITKPTDSTILLNRYELAGDCLVVEADSSNRPIDDNAKESDGTLITSTLDASGNYSLSGTPSAYPVCIIYQVSITRVNRGNISTDQIVKKFELYEANEVNVDASAFSGKLSTSDINVQLALDTIDGFSFDEASWGSITGTLSNQTDLDTRFNVLEDQIEIYEIFELISSGTSGTITKPTDSTILLNRYESASDCLIVKADSSNRPVDDNATESDGTPITSTLDVSGNYSLSGTPSAYPVCIIYQVSISRVNRGNITTAQIVKKFELYEADEIDVDVSGFSGKLSTSDINVQLALDTIDGFGFVDTSGTPVDNQIAVFTDADTIEGDSDLTWSGTELYVNGEVGIGMSPNAGNALSVDGNIWLESNTEVDITAYRNDGSIGPGDNLLIIQAGGDGGEDVENAARIMFEVTTDGWTTGSTPTRIRFYAVETGSTSLTEVLRLRGDYIQARTDILPHSDDSHDIGSSSLRFAHGYFASSSLHIGEDGNDTTITYTNITGTAVYLGGSGLDDLSSSGTYTDTDAATFQIAIDSTGTPDTFQWRKGTGSWTTGVSITGSAQLLQDGISVTFAATTGHKNNDEWLFGVGYRARIDKDIALELTSVNNDLIVAGSVDALGSFNANGDITHSNGDFIIAPNENTDTQAFIWRDEDDVEQLRMEWTPSTDILNFTGNAEVNFDTDVNITGDLTTGNLSTISLTRAVPTTVYIADSCCSYYG